MKKIALLILFISSAYFGLCWFCATLILNPPDRDIAETAEIIQEKWGRSMDEILSEMPPYEEFSVALNDDPSRRIAGWWFKWSEKQEAKADCLVIMAHGWNNTRAGMLKYVPLVEDCACDIVLYDHRAHNESYGKYGTGGIREGEDLADLTHWFIEQGYAPGKIGWIGGSWGAAAVLEAGAGQPDVAFILADSPFQDWETAITERAVASYGNLIKLVIPTSLWLVNLRAGIRHKEANAAEAATQISEAVFLMHSAADVETASSQSEHIAKHLPQHNSVFHHTQWGSQHTLDVVMHKEKVKERFDEFLKNHVPDFGRCSILSDSL